MWGGDKLPEAAAAAGVAAAASNANNIIYIHAHRGDARDEMTAHFFGG